MLFEGPCCVGVEYVHEGESKEARAGTEVIVSAGVMESPKLLMLSGIGNADNLREMGISVKVDLPGVGQNLHDHLFPPMSVKFKQKTPFSRDHS